MSDKKPAAYGEMPLFSKTRIFLDWLVRVSNHFPRLHRHTVTRRLLDAALDFQETILEANALRGLQRLDRLLAADVHLDKVRVYLRLANDWRWLNEGQFEHASRMVAEMGRLLGGWQQATRKGSNDN